MHTERREVLKLLSEANKRLQFVLKTMEVSICSRSIASANMQEVSSKVVYLYSALITTSQRRFTMINLPPADWKHIQAQIAAASKQSMHAGTHFTDLGRMES